jgi:peptide/nickel transport system substrate-binding protein/oligopeptide transport system substrate-binding protein
MVSSRRFRAAIVGILLLLLAVVIACGEEATETAAPAAAATPAAEVVTLPPSVTGQTPAATAAPAAAVPDTDTGPTVPQGTLDVGMAVLGPYVATLYDAGYFQNRFAELITHETLFVMGIDGEWDPRLIKSFDVSADGLTYTMYLQEGAKWHNRTNSGDWGDFNADDFIWSIGQISKEGGKHVQRGNTEKVFRCEGCELTKIDEHTVQLTRPTPTFQITWFSQAPIPGFSMNSKKHYDTVGQDVALLEDVGTAPWEMVEHKTDVHRKLKAVEDHWRNTPEFAEMIWHDIPEESTRLANFLANKLDTGVFNSDSRQAIEDARTAGTNPDVKFMVFPAAIIQMLWFGGGYYTPDSPHHHPDKNGKIRVPVDEFSSDYRNICDLRAWIACEREVGSEGWEKALKVRTAMTISVDRQQLINNIAYGEGEPWYVGIWANRGRMAELGLDKLEWEYDPARAKSLLEEAGYPDGFEVPIAKRQGTGTLLLVKDAVAGMWEKLGLTTKLRNVQPSSYRVTSQARTATDVYGLNDAPSFPEPLRVYSTVYSSSSNDVMGVNHPTMDDLIEKIENTYDTDERWRVQGDLARFIFDNVLNMPLYAENAVWPLGAEVDSWKASPAELDWLSYWDMPRRRR